MVKQPNYGSIDFTGRNLAAISTTGKPADPGTSPIQPITVNQPNTNPSPWAPTYTLPKIKYGDYAVNLKNIGMGLQQTEATTGLTIGDQARAGLYQAGMNVGEQQASADTQRRLERIEKGKQNEIQQQMVRLQERGLELQEESIDKQGGGGMCCFIFIEAYGYLLPIVRQYRDEKMTPRNRRGYYRLADKIVPWMQKSRRFKNTVKFFMTDPLVSYGNWYYGKGRMGVVFYPVVKFWLTVFDLMGRKPYTRSNGEVL